MIKGVLVVNNYGKPRATKFFEYFVSCICCAVLNCLIYVCVLGVI